MGRFDALTQLDDKQDNDQKPSQPKSPISQKTSKDKDASLLVNQQASRLPSEQTSKLVSELTSEEVNQQTSKLVNQQRSNQSQSTKNKKKYGTYLRPDSILNINIHALQEGKDAHVLLQEIVDLYFQKSEK